MTDHRTPGAAALLALVLSAQPALAGPLADPTRPPAALMAPGGLAAAALPHQANRDTARALAAAARAAEPLPPAAPVVVQSVQVPARGAALALVDGRPVTVGDQLDGRKVLAIDAQGLLVQGSRGPERLWLLSGTPKQAAGTIVHSQSARYQPAPAASPLPGNATGTARTDAPAESAAATSDKPAAALSTPPLATPAARSPLPGTGATTSALPTPLSLAGRTAP